MFQVKLFTLFSMCSAASRQELIALFKSKIQDQLHWEVDRPYILREICVDRSPSYGT